MAYFSNLLTATKSRYNSIRGTEDRDGDTEDDSHISRILRTYYAEQGRPYPDWLGPPPNQRAQSPAQSLRPAYGRPPMNAANSGSSRGSGNSATLSDIWDAPQPGGQNQRRVLQQQASRPNLFPDAGEGGNGGGSTGSGITTAQQRIKERLWGSRGGTQSPPSQQQYQPPPMQQQAYQQPQYQQAPPNRGGGGGMPWEDKYSGSSGGGRANGIGNLRRGGRQGLPSNPRGY